jgi:hypothetical protein
MKPVSTYPPSNKARQSGGNGGGTALPHFVFLKASAARQPRAIKAS